jgi:hypothetical protein
VKIVVAQPPNFDEIVAAFPEAANKGVIFAWGDTIYNPSGAHLPNYLLAHEAVHGHQQYSVGSPEFWWPRYIADVEFRLSQELPAHAAEYRIAIQEIKDRNARERMLNTVALKLASKLYNNMITVGEARRKILNER